VNELVTITGIAAGGDGVGRLADGRAVFVPRAAPGERVRLKPDGLTLHKSFARGELDTVLEPVATRVTPPCPHYAHDRCGGCQLQHLAYDAQLAAKRAIVGDALRRIGKLDVPDPEIVEAVEEWRYRTEIVLGVKAATIGDVGRVGLQVQPGVRLASSIHLCSSGRCASSIVVTLMYRVRSVVPSGGGESKSAPPRKTTFTETS